MQRSFLPIAAVGFAALVLLLNTAFVVPQDRQAIVRRFSEYVRTINAPAKAQPGLHFKIPFAEDVVFYDRKNIGLALDGQEFAGSDQQYLAVDAVVRWRIEDPRTFYRAVTTEDRGAQRLEAFVRSAMGSALGGASLNDIISGRRAELMQQVEDDLNTNAAATLGVRVIDVRFRHVDFPEVALDRVYARMRSEREQVAARIRAEGDRNATIIRAQAQQESEQLRGEGDAERARIFARAYGRDPEFAAFYRSMRAYEAAIQQGTPIIVAPDSDFFRYMQHRRGQ